MDCVMWEGSKNRDGYGTRKFRGITWLAHRVAWVEARGEIPRGLNVCHSCDRPACVNVDHLFLGTQKDNMVDCAKKRRTSRGRKHSIICKNRPNYSRRNHSEAMKKCAARGESSGRAKLTEDKVRSLRREHATGATPTELSFRYGINVGTVWKVVARRLWAHVR